MNATPKVSVLIPVYNRARYIGQAIDSILAQSCHDFELLVIDDASTDASRQIVASYPDPRIRLIRNETNLGIPATRNRGMDEARGMYLAFLDSDDVAASNRLAKQAAFLDSHPDYAAVGAWIDWIDEHAKPAGKKIKRKPVEPEQIAAQRLFRSGLENSAGMARLSILREYRHQERYALGSDYDLWARIAADHKLANLSEVLVSRRAHPRRTTQGQETVIKQHRLAIYADQLAKLGIHFDQHDLENHYLLRRMQKTGFKPDAAYLNWAESWLLGLQSANRKTSQYPEPAFSEVLAGFWTKVCLHTVRCHPLSALGCFTRSALRKSLTSGVKRKLVESALRSNRSSAA